MSLISQISSHISSAQKMIDFSGWKEAFLVSAVGLSAIATISQLFVGSFFSISFFAVLWGATYLGYEAVKTLDEWKIKETYYQALKKTTEELTGQCEKFRLENKLMSQNNQDLEKQVAQLTSQVRSMKALLTELEKTASLTQKLLTSCIDVSADQKKTESRVHGILRKLETQVDRHESELTKTLQQMTEQISQFFLKEAKAGALLGIKKEFTQTQQALQAVQKELQETSARLKKVSQEIGKKIKALEEEQNSLSYLQGLAPRILALLQNQSLFQKLSSTDKISAEALQNYWNTSPSKKYCNQ